MVAAGAFDGFQPLRRWTYNFLEQVLTRDSSQIGNMNSEDSGGGDFATRSFFESLFMLGDKDNKGELTVEDLETLFQA